ncbi:MAG TPA: Na+/H+ antiporter subunit E [Acidimicrobiales bacterium]
MSPRRPQDYGRRVLALWIWGVAIWVLLTWTATASQALFGAGFALAAAMACAGLGPVAEAQHVFGPSRLVHSVLLLGAAAWRIVRANLSLARRIWLPTRPLRSGVVIVATEMRSDGALTAVGILTSVIVDNQLMDIDRRRNELQYHAVSVTSDDPEANYEQMNGPIERRIQGLGSS